MKSNKILGILLLLIYVCVATALLNDSFIKPYNLQNMLRVSSMFAIIGIGAVLVIVTGGIDLSTGSLIGLVGCTMTLTMKTWIEYPPAENGAFFCYLIGVELAAVSIGWVLWDSVWKRRGALFRLGPKCTLLIIALLLFGAGYFVSNMEFGNWLTVAVAVTLSLLLSIHLGLLHGLLITKLDLQPFIVTLCGLLCYRGLSRWLTGDKTQGLGTDYDNSLRLLAIGKPCTATFVLLVAAIGLILYGLFRAVFGKSLTERWHDVLFGCTIVVFGLILAFVSSSRYWDGWSVESGDTLVAAGQFEFKFFKLELPEDAIKRPAKLMGYATYPMMISFVALFGLAFRQSLSTDAARKGKQVLLTVAPGLLVIGSVATLFYLKTWIGDETVTLSEPDQTTAWKMAGVFASMAVLMGAVVWIGKTWTSDTGIWGRVTWLSVGFFSILWLLSQTSINETVVQTPFFFLVIIGLVAAVFLNKTVAGRYLQALGNNEEAAKFSGINIDNMKILAYTLCAFCGGLGAILFTLDSNNVEPSGHGSFYELYAIAAAVLGGSSLRGGEGSILGVIIGASILRVLYNAPDMIGVPSQLELFTIGIVILIGVIVDESARKMAARRDRQKSA